jgi:hypothetical protein
VQVGDIEQVIVPNVFKVQCSYIKLMISHKVS